MGPVELKYVPVAVFVSNAVVSRILLAVQKEMPLDFLMLTMLPSALKTKWEHEVNGTDVQSQFTFANTWSLIGSHSGDANLFFRSLMLMVTI